MSNVIKFNGLTTLAIEPDSVLEGAVGKLDEAVVLGIDKEGCVYVASSHPIEKTILTIELAKKALLELYE